MNFKALETMQNTPKIRRSDARKRNVKKKKRNSGLNNFFSVDLLG